MSIRFIILSVVVLSVSSHCRLWADGPILEVGKKFEGEIRGPKQKPSPFVGSVFLSEVPLLLEAGQRLHFSARVIGSGRKVGLMLIDPTGELVADKGLPRTEESISHGIQQIHASGRYKILVTSNLIGPFVLRTSSKSLNDLTVTELKERILEMEAQLKLARTRLERLSR